ncbi:hypothetical protein D918_10022 [Trichuris suis]|nr:hypothetical protein D918_10022 [Trichuris suis]
MEKRPDKDQLQHQTRGPHLPLLFNLVLDELFDLLEESHTLGYHLSTHRPTTPTPELEQSGLTAVAFAVDVAVLGKSVVALNQQLQLCTNFFRSRHLRLNASKCVALSLAPAPKRKTASADVTHSRILLQTGRETYSLLVISPEETEGSTSVPYTPLLQATGKILDLFLVTPHR